MKGLRLSRRGKIIRNLLLALLLWTEIWLNAGAPYLTAAMELHRLERQNMLPPSKILFWEEAPNGQRAQMVGLGDSWVVSAAFARDNGISDRSIAVYPRTEEPMLIWLRGTLEGETSTGELRAGRALAVIQTPEEAVQAELDLRWRSWLGEAKGLRAQRREDGIFLFWVDPTWKDANGEPVGTVWTLSSGTYILRLYQEDGSLIEEYTGYMQQGLHSGGMYLRG